MAAGDSGRKQELTLTRQGETLLEKSLPAWDEAQIRARAVLGRDGADAIYRVGNAVWSRIGRG